MGTIDNSVYREEPIQNKVVTSIQNALGNIDVYQELKKLPYYTQRDGRVEGHLQTTKLVIGAMMKAKDIKIGVKHYRMIISANPFD